MKTFKEGLNNLEKIKKDIENSYNVDDIIDLIGKNVFPEKSEGKTNMLY